MQRNQITFILIGALLAFSLSSCDALYQQTSAVQNNAYVLTTFVGGNKAVSDSTYTFTAMDIADDPQTATLLLKNDGLQDLSFQAPVLSGANAADYAVSTPSATTLTPGASVEMTITLTPSDVGARVAVVTINNKAGDAVFVGNLTCTVADKASAVAPVFSVASGTVFLSASPLKIAMTTATVGALIYYTTNGSTPTSSSTQYTGGEITGLSATFTLKAIAVYGTLNDSPVTSATYTMVTPVAMTNATGAGNAWGAQLGTIETAVAGTNLLVNLTFTTVDNSNNVYLILDNADTTGGASVLTGDLTTGWGNIGLTNTAAFNPEFIAVGWRDGSATYNFGNAKQLSGTTGTDVTSQVTVTQSAGKDVISYLIPLSVLGLDSTHNHLKAIALFGKDTGSGGWHSAIPASIDTNGYTDVDSVATATLGL